MWSPIALKNIGELIECVRGEQRRTRKEERSCLLDVFNLLRLAEKECPQRVVANAKIQSGDDDHPDEGD